VTTTLERPRGVLTAVIDDGLANSPTFDTVAGLRSAIRTSVAENMPLIMAGRKEFFRAGFDSEVMRSGRDLVASLAGEQARNGSGKSVRSRCRSASGHPRPALSSRGEKLESGALGLQIPPAVRGGRMAEHRRVVD
jgi:hypothetical protein